jgi:hypothetical protein
MQKSTSLETNALYEFSYLFLRDVNMAFIKKKQMLIDTRSY